MSEEVKSVSEQKKEDWMNSKWRPMMGWMYMLVCMFDMVVFPVLWSLLQATTHGSVHTQWNPLTLQGAGLFHIAMGAVLGIAAFGRTQEKMAGANNGGMQPVAQSVTTTFSAPAAPAPSFGGTPLGGNTASTFGSTPPAPASTSFTPPASWGTTPIATTASGKKIVPQDDQPII
jgi:hypothetical protein